MVDAESKDHAEFAGRLSIPYLTRSGVTGFKFRTMHDQQPKYIGPHGQETRLYNTLAMDKADRSGILAICFGELDALTLDGLCGIPAVGIPGDQTYKKHPEWRELFRAYDDVLIFQDDDESGREVAKQIKADVDTSRIIRLPTKDVNEYYVKFGKDGITKAAGL